MACTSRALPAPGTSMPELFPLDLDDTLLDFSIPSARGGRKPKGAPVRIEFTRELGTGDLDLILNPQTQHSSAPAVKRLRASHHSLARMLAEGHKPQMCSAVTGYSPSRISILQGDPAFADLVAYYATQVAEVFIDTQKRLAELGTDAIEELQERLDIAPEDFTKKDLMSLVELTMDRSVAPSKRAAAVGAGAGAALQLPTINISFLAPPADHAGVSSDSPLAPRDRNPLTILGAVEPDDRGLPP